MACDGDGVEMEIIDIETVLCKGCEQCQPKEEVSG